MLFFSSLQIYLRISAQVIIMIILLFYFAT